MEDLQSLVEEFSRLMPAMMLGFRNMLFDPQVLGDLTAPQFILLAYLTEQVSCNASSVGEAMHITSGSVSSLTDRLVQRGLIDRSPGNDDRRVVMFSLTPEGKLKHEEVRKKQLERLSDFFSLLGVEKTSTLVALYRVMIQYLQ